MKTKISVVKGYPVLENYTEADVIIKHENIVAINVELKTSYCKIVYTSFSYFPKNVSSVCIEISKDSENYNKKEKKEYTEIIFEEFIGWYFHSVQLSKKVLSVCLIKQ